MDVLRIVVIDDSDQIRRAIVALLENAGHEIVGQAAGGHSGVHEALARRPDLVVIDWRMPDVDGVEATRRIRDALPSVAVIAFCSTAAPDIRAAFAQAGAQACIDKRDIKGLLAAVRTIAQARADPR